MEAINCLECELYRLSLAFHSPAPPESLDDVLQQYTETLCSAQKQTTFVNALIHDIPTYCHPITLKHEYVKVPFKLAQASAYFQEPMTRILKDIDFVIAYLDDIIIFSRTAEEHMSHIRKVFKKLQLAKLSMKLSKCHFFSKEIQYLGHILSTKGIHPLPSKTQAI